ncbi:MAG: hypothetical protein ACK4WH_14795 [Phycisphaerales bacterium]
MITDSGPPAATRTLGTAFMKALEADARAMRVGGRQDLLGHHP